jgi:hypothetical protein
MMLMAGLALLVDTVVIIISVIWSSAIINPLTTWYYSFQYTSPPPIDPGIITPVWPIYYGMLICIWFALLYCVYAASISEITYPYGA